MTTPVRLCVVGSANVDLTFRTSRLPRQGETLTGHSFHLGFGGKGANQAVAAARLGACVSLIASLGRDAFGQDSLQRYRDEGIDVAHVRIDDQRSTGVAAIVVDDDAHNCILVVSGANHGLSPQHIQGASSTIQAADAVVCQLETPVAASLEAFRLAKAAGIRTILNPAPAVPLPDDLLRVTDLCIPNESEIEILTGLPARSLEEATAAVWQLRQRGLRAVALTLGERGALLLDGDETTHLPAHRVEAIDPTGAGDAFTASLAVFWVEGLALCEAARIACAAAALTVTRLGAQAAFPSRVELEAYLRDDPTTIGQRRL